MRMIAAIAVCLAVLAAWRETYALSCAALLIPAFVFLSVAFGIRESGVLRRRFFASFYFKDGSWLRGFFSRTFLVTLAALIGAVLPTLSLCLDLTIWTPQELAVVAGGALTLALLLKLFDTMTWRAARPEAREVLVKRWAVGVNTALLVAALLTVKLMNPPPAYVALTLNDTLEAAPKLASVCPWITDALWFQVRKEAVTWWLWVRTETLLIGGVDLLRWLSGAIFLISGSLSAYAFSRFLAQFAYAADHVEDAR